REGIVCFDVERDVMRGAGAEAPAARRPLRLDVQIDDASGAAARHFEPMVGTIDADLAESERVDEERLLLARVAHRQHRSKEAACRDVLRDLLRRPRVSVVAALFDHFEEQSGRMPGSQVLRAESLLHAAVVDAVPIEMLLPERTGARRNRVAGARELARAGAA